MTVSKAGRYTATLRRCPDHEPVTKSINVVTQDPNFVNDKKICSVFGDPHILTFDGKFMKNCSRLHGLSSYNFDCLPKIQYSTSTNHHIAYKPE